MLQASGSPGAVTMAMALLVVLMASVTSPAACFSTGFTVGVKSPVRSLPAGRSLAVGLVCSRLEIPVESCEMEEASRALVRVYQSGNFRSQNALGLSGPASCVCMARILDIHRCDSRMRLRRLRMAAAEVTDANFRQAVIESPCKRAGLSFACESTVAS